MNIIFNQSIHFISVSDKKVFDIWCGIFEKTIFIYAQDRKFRHLKNNVTGTGMSYFAHLCFK